MLLFPKMLEYGILVINEFYGIGSCIQSRQCLCDPDGKPFPKSVHWEKPLSTLRRNWTRVTYFITWLSLAGNTPFTFYKDWNDVLNYLSFGLILNWNNSNYLIQL